MPSRMPGLRTTVGAPGSPDLDSSSPNGKTTKARRSTALQITFARERRGNPSVFGQVPELPQESTTRAEWRELIRNTRARLFPERSRRDGAAQTSILLTTDCTVDAGNMKRLAEVAASVAFLAMHATRLHFEGEEPEVARQLLGDAAFDGLVYDAKLQDAYRFEQALRTMGANPQARDFPRIGNTLIHLIARYGERPGVSELWISDRIKTLRKRGCDNRCAVDFHGSAPLLAGLETHSVVFAKSILRAELGEAWCRQHLLALPLWNVDSRRHKLFQAGCGKALSEQIRLGLANPIQRLSGDAQCYLYTPMHRAALKGAHKAIPLLWLLGLDGSCQVKPTFSKKIRLMRVSRRKSGRGQEDSMRSASLVSSDHGSDEEKTTGDFEDLFRNELSETGLQVEDGDARPEHQQEFGEQERDLPAPDAEQTNKFHRDAAGAGRASRAPGRNSFHKISIVSNAPGAGFAGGAGGEDEDLLDPTGSSSARNSFGKSSVLSNTWAFARKLSSSSPSQRKTSSVRSFGNGAQQAQATVAQVLAASSRNYSAKPAFASKWYFDEAELHRLETPLWMAVRYGRKEFVEALLHCGCVPRPNSKSESPAKVAEQLGFADVAALLYEHCPTETSSVGKCKPSKSTSDDPAACNSMARTGSDHGSEAPSKVSSSNPSPGIHAVVCEAEAALAGAAEAAGPEKRPEQKQEFCSSTWEAACAPWQKAADIHFDAVDALAELVENDILHIESYESLCDWYFSLGAASWERVYVFWKLFCNQGAFLQAAMEEAEKEKTRLGGGEAALLMQPGLKGNRNMMSTTVAGMSTEFASRTAYRSTGVSSHQPTMTSGSGNPGNFHLLSTPAAAARLFGTRILRRWAAEDLHCFESSLATLAAGNYKGHVDGGQHQHQQQAAAAIAKDVRSPGLHSESYYNYDYFANAFYSSVPIPGRRISDNDKDKVDPMLLTDMMDIV